MQTIPYERGDENNGESSPEVREQIGAQLQEENLGNKEFIQAITERDDRIDELTSLLTQARDELETREEAADNAMAEFMALKEEKDEAIAACCDALRLAHPEVPADLIRGETVEELNNSVHSGRELVDRVRKALQSERDATRVPAGAPVSGGPDLDGLTPREKIATGITARK